MTTKKRATQSTSKRESRRSKEEVQNLERTTLSPAQTIFIEEYLISGNKTTAAEKAGVSRTTPYDWFRNDFEFVAEYNRRRREFNEEVRAELSALRPGAVRAIGASIDEGDVKSAWKLLESSGDLSAQNNGAEDAHQLVRNAIADEVFRIEDYNYRLIRAMQRLYSGLSVDGWEIDGTRLVDLLREAGLFVDPRIVEDELEHGLDGENEPSGD